MSVAVLKPYRGFDIEKHYMMDAKGRTIEGSVRYLAVLEGRTYQWSGTLLNLKEKINAMEVFSW